MVPSNHSEWKSKSTALVIVLCLGALVPEVSAFSLISPLVLPAHTSIPSSTHARTKIRRSYNIRISGVTASHGSKSDNTDQLDSDDAQLLKQVKKQQLAELCEQLGLSTKGKREDLLKRLRNYAEEQTRAMKEHNQARVARVEDRIENPNGRERFELVESYDDEDEDDSEDYFFLPIESLLPSLSEKKESAEVQAKSKSVETPSKSSSAPDDNQTVRRRPMRPLTSSEIVAPPPPLHIEPNENGERVVTVYSSSDMNDLTGVAAAQPGQAAISSSNDAMMSSSSSMDGEQQPWEMPNEKKTTEEEDQEKQKMTELVQTLLLLSGAPAFREYDYDLAGLSTLNLHVPNEFVGFDPSSVPSELWNKYEGSFRSQEGMNLLHDVLREIELYAIGQDGMAGDNPDKGGGHFREVNKVRAFLEGYGRAQIRKCARETLTMLLDKLASEGLEGLDLTLASMTRRGDSSSAASTGAELNDSLLQYLNDAIRQQERKVQRVQASQATQEGNQQHHVKKDLEHDPLEGLWKVHDVKSDKNRGDDDMIEATLDPKDPVVKKVLTVEYNKLTLEEERQQSDFQVPSSGPEQLLLLLTLLRERIKAEAAFVPDERGRNLRLLAYCLKCSNAMDRESLITSQLGTAIDRYDSFAELVASSIEYAESTSSQLQPAKTRDKFPVLNLPSLKSILELTKDIREKQAWKASGAKPSGNL